MNNLKDKIAKSIIEEEANRRLFQSKYRHKTINLKNANVRFEIESTEGGSKFPWKDIIIGLIIFAVTTGFYLIVIPLNRDVGVLHERTASMSKKMYEISKRVNITEIKMNDVNMQLQLIKNSEEQLTIKN